MIRKYTSATKSIITVESSDLDFMHETGRRVNERLGPYTDDEVAGLNPVYRDAINAATVVPYTPPAAPDPMAELRAERDRLLDACDRSQLVDGGGIAPTQTDQDAWATYRQALRDLPENTIDPENPDWPQAPDVGVYAFNTSTDKYHRLDCIWAGSGEHLTLSEIAARTGIPCTVCNPPDWSA